MSGTDDDVSDNDDGPTMSLFGGSTVALAATAQRNFLELDSVHSAAKTK